MTRDCVVLELVPLRGEKGLIKHKVHKVPLRISFQNFQQETKGVEAGGGGG